MHSCLEESITNAKNNASSTKTHITTTDILGKRYKDAEKIEMHVWSNHREEYPINIDQPKVEKETFDLCDISNDDLNQLFLSVTSPWTQS